MYEQTKSGQTKPPLPPLSSQPASTNVNMVSISFLPNVRLSDFCSRLLRIKVQQRLYPCQIYVLNICLCSFQAVQNPHQPKQMQPATGSNASANGTASRKWFPISADTAAFTSGGQGNDSLSELSGALESLHITPPHVVSADGSEVPLESGEITPDPSVDFDVSPQSVIPSSQRPPGVNDIQSLLPWLVQDRAADSKPKAAVPEPSNGPSAPAAMEGSGDDVENLMALLMG